MRDQAAKLRDLAKATLEKENIEKSTTGPRIIAVTSGKGGVGKSNIVVNLGIALEDLGYKVLIFDADLGLANAEVLLGIVPKYSLYDVLKGEKELSEILVHGPTGITLISGGIGFKELANLNRHQREKILTGLKVFEHQVDFILIDTGAGINKNVLGFISAADDVIVVATPELTSLSDAYTLIKVLSKFKIHSEVKLLINRASDEMEANQTTNKIKLVASKYLDIKIDYLGFVLDDFLVGKAVRDQIPFSVNYPNSPATLGVRNVAAHLVNRPQVAIKGINRFISNLMRFFG